MSARALRGQAAVETALTMPLFLFMILGTLQLFMLLQARLMAEHAVLVATRTGSLSSGQCSRMKHAALLTLLPTFAHTTTADDLVAAFSARLGNRYQPVLDAMHDGEIVWLFRQVPGASGVRGTVEDDRFDDPDARQRTLETRLVFWYPMRIPFANWIIARSIVAAWAGGDYVGVNPLAPTQLASWAAVSTPGAVDAAIMNALKNRTGRPKDTYVFPIQATAAMRMLTSPRLDGSFIFPGVCK
jgi:hypothetical protein